MYVIVIKILLYEHLAWIMLKNILFEIVWEFLELILDLPKCGIISPINLLNVDVKNA
jgi:hypothetical protein